MTPSQLNTLATEIWGPDWKRPCAVATRRGERSLYRYASGERTIPDGLRLQLVKELAKKHSRIERLREAIR